MKKSFLMSLALVLAVGLTPVVANNKNGVDDRVKNALEKEFPGATLVKWNDVEDYHVASFVFDGVRVEAYYDLEGELQGYGRCVQFERLPLPVTMAFEKRFKGAYFLEALEVSNEDGTSYWVSVETGDQKYRVHMNPDGRIMEKKKIRLQSIIIPAE